MKKFIFILFLAMTSQGHAAIFNASTTDTFDYGGFTWTPGFTPSTNNNGQIGTGTDANGGVFDVQIIGSDTGTFQDPIESGYSGMTTAITESGTISFSWDYFTTDISYYDPFVWLTHGSGPTRITAETCCNPDEPIGTGISGNQTGLFSQHVEVGMFALAILSDSVFGNADVGLNNFSFTADIAGNPVPVPPAFLLFGTALAGLSYFRKKKSAAAV